MSVFYGVSKPKSNQENPIVFIRPFGPLFSLIHYNRRHALRSISHRTVHIAHAKRSDPI